MYSNIKRVCVIGCSGSGKTTFSNNLNKACGLPVYHLDTIFYDANWVAVKRDVFDHRLIQILKKEQWIIDGNYPRTMPLRFEYADTIIFLDYPRWRSIYGLLKRIAIDYGKNRPDMAAGCNESFNWAFIKKVFNFRKKIRPQIIDILNTIGVESDIQVFTSPKQSENWLKQKKL